MRINSALLPSLSIGHAATPSSKPGFRSPRSRSSLRSARNVVRLLPTKPCRTRVGDREWHNGRRAPTQDPSTNNRRLCVSAQRLQWRPALTVLRRQQPRPAWQSAGTVNAPTPSRCHPGGGWQWPLVGLVSDLPCHIRREGGQSLVMLEGKEGNPL